ncbi:MAG: sulfurtransferase TusA family protein [Promethearchaeota archaeon]
MRGRVCPMTFVYTKLALEKLKEGEILEVMLDYTPALKNIPDSCTRQKLAEVLEIKRINTEEDTWILRLKRI